MPTLTTIKCCCPPGRSSPPGGRRRADPFTSSKRPSTSLLSNATTWCESGMQFRFVSAEFRAQCWESRSSAILISLSRSKQSPHERSSAEAGRATSVRSGGAPGPPGARYRSSKPFVVPSFQSAVSLCLAGASSIDRGDKCTRHHECEDRLKLQLDRVDPGVA